MNASRESQLELQVRLLAAALGLPVEDAGEVIPPDAVVAASEPSDTVRAVRSIRQRFPTLSLLQAKLLVDEARRGASQQP